MSDRPILNYLLLQSRGISVPRRAERVLQFGGGVFLRGFVDWMIHRLNEGGRFDGRIVIVQSTPAARRSDDLNLQDGLYTLVTRGVQNGRTIDEAEVMTSVSRALNARTQWRQVLEVARSPELQLIVSNTTEAGIVTSSDDRLNDSPPTNFPAKLTACLFGRFKSLGLASNDRLIVMPCELIDDNGDVLKHAVLELSERWKLPEEFLDWLERRVVFCNTLVDRIVTGYPADRAQAAQILDRLGYEDRLLNVAEPFHFFAIQGDESIAKLLPFHEIGLNVVWADDITRYRMRKVRILNGAHTMFAPAAFLAEYETVRECVEDPSVRRFIDRGLFDEILPSLGLPRDDAEQFARDVLERFANPFVEHPLLNITLNSTSKFRVRLLPTIREYIARFGRPPTVLTFSLASLIAFYRGSRADQAYPIQDDPKVLEAFSDAWQAFPGMSAPLRPWITGVLSNSSIWGQDMTSAPDIVDVVAGHLHAILTRGPRAAMLAIADSPPPAGSRQVPSPAE